MSLGAGVEIREGRRVTREALHEVAKGRVEKTPGERRPSTNTRYGSPNPFPWMSETMDLRKEKNFFETQVSEYRSAAGLSWD